MQKIDKKLVKVYAESGIQKQIDCIVFLRDFFDIQNQYCDVEIIKEYKFINALAIKINLKDMLSLSKQEQVRYIASQSIVKMQIQESKKVLNIEKFYKDNIFGLGVNIAVIDTGIEPMLDFTIPQNRIIKFIDFVNGFQTPYDDNGHGTFVSGVLLGNGLVSNYKYKGIAPKSSLISLKALDSSGEASALKVLDAMQWIYENKSKYKIKVVCMSFGSEPLDRNDPLSIGVEALWKSGIVVVVAGGNSGPDKHTIKSPGINKNVITVGGADVTSSLFSVPNFSSRGPANGYFKPDIIAPAVDIISNNNQIINGKAYTKMSGTSVATPMIAGVCALVVEKYPYYRPDQVKSYILRHGKSLGYDRNVEGFGIFLA